MMNNQFPSRRLDHPPAVRAGVVRLTFTESDSLCHFERFLMEDYKEDGFGTVSMVRGGGNAGVIPAERG